MSDIESIERRLDALCVQVQKVHDDVLVIQATFNGGPGKSWVCQQHQEAVKGMVGRVEKLEKRFEWMLGAVAVLIVLSNLILPKVRAVLGL
jgi:hypothetical protein